MTACGNNDTKQSNGTTSSSVQTKQSQKQAPWGKLRDSGKTFVEVENDVSKIGEVLAQNKSAAVIFFKPECKSCQKYQGKIIAAVEDAQKKRDNFEPVYIDVTDGFPYELGNYFSYESTMGTITKTPAVLEILPAGLNFDKDAYYADPQAVDYTRLFGHLDEEDLIGAFKYHIGKDLDEDIPHDLGHLATMAIEGRSKAR